MISGARGEILRLTLPQSPGAADISQRTLLCSYCDHLSHHASWIAGNNCVVGYITCNYAAGTDYGVFADGDPAQNRRAGTNRRATLDYGLHYPPVGFRLRIAVLIGGAGIFVIDEGNVVANENVVFDGHAFANEGVTRHLHVVAY